jgi:hypothetical protein
MKVTCKTLQGAAFQVECEPTETVAALKQKIQGANPTLLAEHAVTVFQGKVLQDASSLADAGVSETGFVVVMIKKPAAGARARARAAHGAANALKAGALRLSGCLPAPRRASRRSESHGAAATPPPPRARARAVARRRRSRRVRADPLQTLVRP